MSGFLTLEKKNDNYEIAWRHNWHTGQTQLICYSTDPTSAKIVPHTADEKSAYIDQSWFKTQRYAVPERVIQAVTCLIRTNTADVAERDRELVAKLYKEITAKILEAALTMMPITHQSMAFYPVCTHRPKQRDFFLINGPSGCGKTQLARNILSAYKHTNPIGKIYIFTNKVTSANEPIDDLGTRAIKVPKEEWFDFFATVRTKKQEEKKKGPHHRSKRIRLEYDSDGEPIEGEWLDDEVDEIEDIPDHPAGRTLHVFNNLLDRRPIDVEKEREEAMKPKEYTNWMDEALKSYDWKPLSEIQDCMILGDDLQNVTPPRLAKFMNDAFLMVMQLGRSDKINLIKCGHLVETYRFRHDLNECTHFSLFPAKMSQHHFKMHLEKYLNLPPVTVRYAMAKFKGERVLTIVKEVPPIAITEKEIVILGDNIV